MTGPCGIDVAVNLLCLYSAQSVISNICLKYIVIAVNGIVMLQIYWILSLCFLRCGAGPKPVQVTIVNVPAAVF